MIRPRNFAPRESILSDDLKATRPRVPLKSLAGEGKQGHRVDHEGRYPWQLWGCQGGVWGTCGGAARAGSPTKMQPREARPLSLPSGSEVSRPHAPDPLPSPTQGRPSPGHSSAPVSAYPAEVKRLPFRAPRGCAPEQTRTRLRRNPLCSGTRCREPPLAAAH